ncbi:hypothetical protein JCM11641_000275 [Rhodosporidiobolus odoratus]
MASTPASVLGVPLSLISLVTLTVQNSALTIVLHYSRISVPKDRMYNAASAVLLNELLKGAISLSIAFRNSVLAASSPVSALERGEYSKLELNDGGKQRRGSGSLMSGSAGASMWTPENVVRGGRKMLTEVFSNDCWKLSIPACLYVIQNNLQFVAASNLDVPTFQVTYNLKILTTALFSVLLLRRRLSGRKWFALLFLAAGVGVVQLQSTAAAGSSSSHGSHEMDKSKGLLAVFCACMTSGLAGVYFEMVLKGSKADLWIRNVQLSIFSLLPAAMAVFAPGISLTGGPSTPSSMAEQPVFANFGGWAWAVVLIQVFGGLVTALVIRYSDNIMKGFATSLAIVLSFCAGIILFDFQVTLSFLVGTIMVVTSTYLYNSPEAARRGLTSAVPSHHPSTLPSPSVSKGSFTPPTSFPPSSANTLSSYSSHSALAALRASSAATSSTSPSLSLTGSATPTYGRRPNPQHLPPGAQTPDHCVQVFEVNASPQLHQRPFAASAPGSSGADNPYVNPAAAASGFSRPPSVPPSPNLANVYSSTSTLSPRSSPDVSKRASWDGYSSSRASGTAPGSPDPAKRKGSQAYGSDGQPRWS